MAAHPLQPSEAIEQLNLSASGLSDIKLFQSIRRQLTNQPHCKDWTKRFLKLGGWEHLLDHLQRLSRSSPACTEHKNGKSSIACICFQSTSTIWAQLADPVFIPGIR